jgi:transposase
LSKVTVGGETVISFGGRAVFVFDPEDRGMRNLAIVALRGAGVSGLEVAAMFALRPEHVSRLVSRAKEQGSAGLVTEQGRPRSLDEQGVKRAYARRDEGRSGAEIAREMGVSEATISRLLARRIRPEAVQLELGGIEDAGSSQAAPERPSPDSGVASGTDAEDTAGTDTADEDTAGTGTAGTGTAGTDTAGTDTAGTDTAGTDTAGEYIGGEETAGPDTVGEDTAGDRLANEDPSTHAPAAGLARIAEGVTGSAYAGSMLLHGFLDRAGAGEVLAALRSPGARRYDAHSVMLSATFGFALGSLSAEGTKHLLASDAGATIGLDRLPHLRTLRPRLSAIADAIDPLALQCAIAKAMLDADERPPEVFFVDDHFVAYAGVAPVQKGWNTRRRHAEPGRDDTVVVDENWRAICFSSGPPSGLSSTMFGPLDQLRGIVGERRVMIGFDRGGSYPKVFAELKSRGFDFVSYRRAPLKEPQVEKTRTWTVVEGKRAYMSVADETVALEGYGTVRQISVYEHGRLALQILTSDMDSSAAYLARRLVGRWCIENAFKYLEDHHGIHWLCDYRMELSADTTKVANPQRAEARAGLAVAEAAVAAIERAIGTTATNTGEDLAETNRELARLKAELAERQAERDLAKQALKPIPAKMARNELDPGAVRAVSVLARRALQMVCRLLAYNAELDLARNLNAYLEDDNEYRAITRNLLHQPGSIAYGPSTITVTLRAPDAPRVTKALGRLCDQLNAAPPRMSGDRRPITYVIAART